MKNLHKGKEQKKKKSVVSATAGVKGKKTAAGKKGDFMETMFENNIAENGDDDEFIGFSLEDVQEVHIHCAIEAEHTCTCTWYYIAHYIAKSV